MQKCTPWPLLEKTEAEIEGWLLGSQATNLSEQLTRRSTKQLHVSLYFKTLKLYMELLELTCRDGFSPHPFFCCNICNHNKKSRSGHKDKPAYLLQSRTWPLGQHSLPPDPTVQYQLTNLIDKSEENNHKTWKLTWHLKQERWKSFPIALILGALVCPFFGTIDLRQPLHFGLNFLQPD